MFPSFNEPRKMKKKSMGYQFIHEEMWQYIKVHKMAERNSSMFLLAPHKPENRLAFSMGETSLTIHQWKFNSQSSAWWSTGYYPYAQVDKYNFYQFI